MVGLFKGCRQYIC